MDIMHINSLPVKANMTIDLEALAHVMHVTLDIEQNEPTLWGCSLRGVSIKDAPTDDRSTSACATGHNRESAADNLAQMIRGKLAYKMGWSPEFFHVPTCLFAGVK